MRCHHCFLIKQQSNAQELSLKEYKMFFSKAAGRLSQVLFTGGEPTLRDDFADILIAAAKEGRCDSVSIFTNGILRERLMQVINRVLDETSLVLSLQLSIDGLEEFHDANRGFRGAMKETISTIGELKEIKNKFSKRFARMVVATAISRENIDDLSAIISMVKKTGLLHAFGFVRGSKVSVFNLEHQEELSGWQPVNFDAYLSVQDMDRALEILNRGLWSENRHSLYYATNRTILQAIRDSLMANRPLTPCMAGLAEITLMPNGDIARCEMLRPCANLKDFDFDLSALIASEAFKANYKKTYGCWCTHECAVGTSIMYDMNLLNNVFNVNGFN
jgi:MoaA/NifB/PqqE/SkfB family radical SAM enzyme